jgi:hypothetical protein
MSFRPFTRLFHQTASPINQPAATALFIPFKSSVKIGVGIGLGSIFGCFPLMVMEEQTKIKMWQDEDEKRIRFAVDAFCKNNMKLVPQTKEDIQARANAAAVEQA